MAPLHPRPALSVDHGAPVETFVAFPSAALVASGGGTALKLWDLVMGRSLAEADAHSKAGRGRSPNLVVGAIPMGIHTDSMHSSRAYNGRINYAVRS